MNTIATAGTVAPTATARSRNRFALTGLLVGPLTAAATIISAVELDPSVLAAGPDAIAEALADSRGLYQFGAIAGLAATFLLIAWVAGFQRFVESRADRDHLAVRVTQFAGAGAVGAMVIAFSLKAAFAGGLPGAIDSLMYTTTDVAVLHILHEQLQWVGLLSMVGAMYAVAWLALRERVLPRFLGVVSLVLALFVTGMTLGLALPYSAGVVVPVWILVTSVWLLVRRERGV